MHKIFLSVFGCGEPMKTLALILALIPTILFAQLQKPGESSGSTFDPRVTNLKIYNVLDYGAVSGGVETITANNAAFTAAISAARSVGGTVFIPTGTYWHSSTIVLDTTMRLIGSGDMSRLVYTGRDDAVRIRATADAVLYYVEVGSLTIYGNIDADNGINIRALHNGSIHDVNVFGVGGNGIKMSFGANTEFHNIRIGGSGPQTTNYGFVLDTMNSAANYPSVISVNNLEVRATELVGILVNYAHGCRFTSCTAQSNKAIGIKIASDAKRITLDNCWMETNPTWSLLADGTENYVRNCTGERTSVVGSVHFEGWIFDPDTVFVSVASSYSSFKNMTITNLSNLSATTIKENVGGSGAITLTGQITSGRYGGGFYASAATNTGQYIGNWGGTAFWAIGPVGDSNIRIGNVTNVAGAWGSQTAKVFVPALNASALTFYANKAAARAAGKVSGDVYMTVAGTDTILAIIP